MAPSQPYKIRPIEPDDLPKVIELIASAISSADAEFARSIFAYYFREGRSKRQAEYYVVELGGKVVGVSGFYRRGEAYWLGWFAVSEEYRKLGIGSALLERVEEEVKARGARELYVYTSSLPKFEGTREFYRRRGFEEVCEVDHPRWERDMLFLRKRLS